MFDYQSINNVCVSENQAYVRQQDVFYSQLTVRETLLMAARLRLPRSMPLEEKTQMVDDLINNLGLSKVTRVKDCLIVLSQLLVAC